MGKDDKKAVPSDPIEFGKSDIEPDRLRDIDDIPKETNQTSQSQDINFIRENMTYLGEKIKELFRVISKGSNNLNLNLEGIQGTILPYVIRVSTTGLNTNRLEISLNSIQVDYAKIMFEAIYGPKIKMTGIFEDLSLDKKSHIKISDIAHTIGEFEQFKSIEQYQLQQYMNPYLTIMALPLETRAFFTSTTKKATTHKRLLYTQNGYTKLLTLTDIMESAEELGELTKVSHYAKLYGGI